MRGSSVLMLIALLGSFASAQKPVPVKTSSGELVGTSNGAVRAYLGVPFAAPPVGDLRWKRPQPVTKSAAPLAADKIGDACPQNLTRSRLPFTEEYMVQNDASENCLSLNIWAPQSGNAHAVLVFFHGGGFAEGSNGIAAYDGTSLAKRGIIVVNANYRIGMLGFFANSELKAETSDHSAGNYGLADQIAALEWVKRNITAFGGDPDKVAIAGQSAGAAAVVDLLASPESKGLFQRAMIHSGLGLLGPTPLAAAAEAGDKWTEAHGGSLKAVRAMSANDILNAKDVPPVLLRPLAGDHLLPKAPIDTLEDGTIQDVPLMIGWVANDVGVGNGRMTAQEFRDDAHKKYGAQAEEFLALYPATDDATAKDSQKQSGRDHNFAVAQLWADMWQKKMKSPVYLFYLSKYPQWPEHPEYGAHHTSELPYFFGTLDRTTHRKYDSSDQKVSEFASNAWVHFAESGNPGSGWKAAGGDGPWQVLDEPTVVKPELDAKKMEFWRKQLEKK